MKSLRIFFLLTFSLLFVNIASALDTFENGTEMNISIVCLNDGYCSNDSYCNINVINPNSNIIISNQNMTNQISSHVYNFTPTNIGVYSVGGFCKDGEYSEEIDYKFEVTKFGNPLSIYGSIIHVVLLLLSVGGFLGLKTLNTKIDYKKWYDGIIAKYKSKNYIKMAFSSIGYNVMKNTFAIYYFLGFLILLIVSDMIFTYNIISLTTIIERVMMVYSLGILAVAFMMFGEIQEFLYNMKDDALNALWGITGDGE